MKLFTVPEEHVYVFREDPFLWIPRRTIYTESPDRTVVYRWLFWTLEIRRPMTVRRDVVDDLVRILSHRPSGPNA